MPVENIFEFLLHQQQEVCDRLYSNIWACQSVFRSLPPIAKQYIFRIIFFKEPVGISTLSSLLKPSGVPILKPLEDLQCPEYLRCAFTDTNLKRLTEDQIKTHLSALDRMVCLKLLYVYPDPAAGDDQLEALVLLNSHFQEQIQETMCPSDLTPSAPFSLPGERDRSDKEDKHAMAPEEVDKYAQEKWDSILQYITSEGSSKKFPVLPEMAKLLSQAHLVERKGSTVRITQEGFRFMLMDAQSQIWTLLNQLLENTQPEEVLQFLFELSFCKRGKPYPTKVLSDQQRIVLKYLVEFGMIYCKQVTDYEVSSRFYPTCYGLAIAMAMQGDTEEQKKAKEDADVVSLQGMSALMPDQGFIIVETNYRVYAYVSSNVQISLLGFFVSISCRLPNLIMGTITRESIRYAFECGITAKQILAFLHQHAHPQMRKRPGGEVLPEGVAIQIRLWEQERNRVECTDSVVFHGFSTEQAFMRTEQYAKESGALVWSSKAKLMIVVRDDKETKAAISAFIARLPRS